MNAGKLKNRITLQRQSRRELPSGQQVEEWTDLATVWAEAKCTQSRTASAEGAQQGELVYKFFIRWRPDIRAGMRIRWQGRIFELIGPPADWEADRSGLTLLARELVDNGTAENPEE